MLDTLSDDTELIAPCGMNCSVCGRYLARKYDVNRKGLNIPYCAGCSPQGKKCAFQKRCELLRKNKVRFVMNAAVSRATTWSRLTHGIKSITIRVSSKISPLSRSIRLLLLWSVRMRSGGVSSVEQCC